MYSMFEQKKTAIVTSSPVYYGSWHQLPHTNHESVFGTLKREIALVNLCRRRRY